MSLPRLTPREVRARRLARHGLTRPLADASPAGAAAAMHGAHAQVMSAAEVSVAIRLPGSTRQSVREAMTDGSLTKTFGPRGTVHLLPTRDLPLWVGALGSVPHGGSAFPADVRLTDAQTAEVVAAVGDALLGGELTADELDAEVVARTGSWAGDPVMPAFQGFWPRWRQAIGRCAHAGVLVFGAGRGRKVTYTNPRLRDPAFVPAAPEVAEPWFVAAYLRAYGPATAQDLARWNAAPLPWARSLLGAAPTTEVDVDHGSALVNAGDTEPEPLGRSVRLLPYFDALGVGFAPREEMFPGRARERALAGAQAGNYPVLLVDGIVQGVWHQRRSGRRIHVTVETWADLGPTRLRALDAQVARLGEILEGEPRLTLGEVTVGPHA